MYLAAVFVFTTVRRRSSFIICGRTCLSAVFIISKLMVTGENVQTSLIVLDLIVVAENTSV